VRGIAEHVDLSTHPVIRGKTVSGELTHGRLATHQPMLS
jgi:hypothetical protein